MKRVMIVLAVALGMLFSAPALAASHPKGHKRLHKHPTAQKHAAKHLGVKNHHRS